MDKIDSTIWVTQQALANELTTSSYKCSVQRVHNWIRRGKIDTKFIPELNITLVNRLTAKVKTISQ
jgi:hypothetical protein